MKRHNVNYIGDCKKIFISIKAWKNATIQIQECNTFLKRNHINSNKKKNIDQFPPTKYIKANSYLY